MIIRRAKKKDIEKLSVLFDKYRIFYKQRSDVDNAMSFLKKRMKRKESVIFVAEEREWLILQTAADNFTAQKLYEKNGWVRETDFFYRKDI